MTDNLSIWNQLGKTDPAHTKSFSRAGGFKGTATRPVYLDMKMTETFGPCGVGWGMGRPSFELVDAGSDKLVFCTVEVWYEQDSVHGVGRGSVWGVGGDKVLGSNKNGPYSDDEAFKKAYTDAIGNAMKYLGMSADVHMGKFEDSKYVNELKRELNGKEVMPNRNVESAGNNTSPPSATAGEVMQESLDEVERINARQRCLDAIWNASSASELDVTASSAAFKKDIATLTENEKADVRQTFAMTKKAFAENTVMAG